MVPFIEVEINFYFSELGQIKESALPRLSEPSPNSPTCKSPIS